MKNLGATVSGIGLLIAWIAGGSDPSVVSYLFVCIGFALLYTGLKLVEKSMERRTIQWQKRKH
ncbi:MAG: hypothetical protein GX938_09510 [Spirochaetales bacterium]|nr:hypothetical protein [Spirochaetales bacterium]